jgi:hypothetical protein
MTSDIERQVKRGAAGGSAVAVMALIFLLVVTVG